MQSTHRAARFANALPKAPPIVGVLLSGVNARRCLVGLAAMGTVLVVAGCGSSSSSGAVAGSNGESQKSGPQVVKDAVAAMQASGAVHVSGIQPNATSENQVTQVDLQLQSDDSSGSVTLNRDPVQFIVVGGAIYLKAPAALYVAQNTTPAIAAKLANKWVKAPSQSAFNEFTLAMVSQALGKPETKATIDSKTSTGKLNGQPVVIVKQSDGAKLYVAATGQPYPLKTTSGSANAGLGTAEFTGYGKHVTITAPTSFIDASQG